MRRFLFLSCLIAVTACDTMATDDQAAGEATTPVMQWDFRPEAETWTAATLRALETHGAELPAMVPADYAEWCPDYPNQTPEMRAAFWSGLLSALAKHESTWNPEAVGGNGSWYGLVQIAPGTAQGYGCAAQTGAELQSGPANLSCAVRIASAQVTERGTINRGMLDWGPFHSQAKRSEMAAWTRAQPYCTGESDT